MLLQSGKRQATLLTQCVGSHTSLGPGGHYQDFHEHLNIAGLQETDCSHPFGGRTREPTVLIGIRMGDLLHTCLLTGKLGVDRIKIRDEIWQDISSLC